jgi:plastocyanin domain-containing protein
MTRTTKLLTLALLLAIPLGACNKGGDSGEAGKKPAGITAGTVNDKGERRVPVEVGKQGYVPEEIAAKAGEKLVLVFTRTYDTECGRYVKLAGGEAKELPLNQPVELPVDVPQSGAVKFVCGMDMMTGQVVVASK